MGKKHLPWQTRWLQVLFGGVVLFFASERALRITGNPNFFPTVILLGSFAVPAAFVTYFYEQERWLDRVLHKELSLATLATAFFLGGAIGIIVAGLVEYETIRTTGMGNLVGISVIEEGAKLIVPVGLYFMGRYKTQADGLLFGVASGMGFAALETMGYALTAMLKSSGNVAALEEVLLVRGFFSPAGHAAWTGLICAVIWRERKHGYSIFTVAGTFGLVVVLHSLWNATNLLPAGGANFVLVGAANLVIAAISVLLLFGRLRDAENRGPGAAKNTTVSSTGNAELDK